MNAAPRAADARIATGSDAGEDAAPGDPEVDDRLAPAVEHGVHERAERADLAGRPGERAVEHVEGAADEDDDAADEPELGSEQRRADDGDPEADERQPVGVRPRRPIPSAIGSKTFLIRPRDSFEIVIGSAGHAEDRALARGEFGERLLAQAADRLAAVPARLDHAGGAEAAEVPRHERLRQPDMRDELGDGGLAVGEPAHDAQTVDVGHDLVEGTQLAEVFGLGDGRGDGAADPGGRGGQGWGSGWGGAPWHINHGLYQSPLMLRRSQARCQG